MTLQTPVEEKLESFVPVNEGYRSVLANKNFLALWIGQIFSQLGDRVVFVVFIAAIATYFGANDRYNSFLYIAFTIPAILLTAIAGVFVDRWPRRLVLVVTNILRAIFVAFLPLAAQNNLMGIYGLAFLLSSATQFFVPAEAATIPMIVRKSQLLAANSLFTTTMMASIIFGFALGDPLINIFGLEEVHWSIVGLFVLASITLVFVKAPPPPAVAAENGTGNGAVPQRKGATEAFRQFFAEMHDGIDYIRNHSVVLNAILKLALLFSTVVALCILFISFARDFLYDDPKVAAQKFAYIVTYSGIGMALGAVIVGRFFREVRRGWLVFGGFTCVGLFLVLLSMIDMIPRELALLSLGHSQIDLPFRSVYLENFNLTARMLYTYVLATVMGVGASFVAIPLQAMLHEMIPEDKRGKVMGVQFTILSTCSTAPVLAAGLGVEYIGTRTMLLLIGGPLLLLGLAGLYKRFVKSNAVADDW